MSRRHFRVCAHGHTVYDDSAVTCPRCGVPLRRRGDGGLARLGRGTRSALHWALSIGVLILAVGLLVATYRLSAPLRGEVVAILGGQSPEWSASALLVTEKTQPTSTPALLTAPFPQTAEPTASPTPTAHPPTPTLACDLLLDYSPT